MRSSSNQRLTYQQRLPKSTTIQRPSSGDEPRGIFLAVMDPRIIQGGDGGIPSTVGPL
jgi:hypothetical protein